jgi:hypothetical protein
MNRRPTRRTIGKLLIATPAALSAAVAACRSATQPPPDAQPRPVSPGGVPLSPKERQDYEKAVKQLRKSLEAVRKTSVPVGAEPAFAFAPLLPSEPPVTPAPPRRRPK